MSRQAVMTAREDHYLGIFVDCVRSCAAYRPKFGQGKGAGLTLAEFRDLYRADPFYMWLGLDDPKLYTAHRSAGGMTSIYRQIGIACERVFRSYGRNSCTGVEVGGVPC